MMDETIREHTPLDCIKMERIKQDAKWLEQNHSNLRWLPILMEEVGEVAEMVNESLPIKRGKYSEEGVIENLEYELIQVAAVCIAWIECIRRKK